MIDYTVVFNRPDNNTPEFVCIDTPEFVHINTLETRYVHLMFFGRLANEWGYDWDDMRFAPQTDLSLPHGTIMIKDKPLYYDIVAGNHTPTDMPTELAPLAGLTPLKTG